MARSIVSNCSRLARPAAIALCTVLSAGLAAVAATIPITEFPLPAVSSDPAAITTGPDGNLWFIEIRASKIGKMSPSGVVLGEFPVAANVFYVENPAGIAPGPDGNVWFTEPLGNKIARITPAGVITEFPLPTALADPAGITPGPDGNLWFTEYNSGKIGRITTAGAITEMPLPNAGSAPTDITTGPDGNLWFTEGFASKIGRITTAGALTEFPCPPSPIGIASGPDGNLWFTLEFTNQIGRMTVAGDITKFPTTNPAYQIATGTDGNLWFVENQNANAIGWITTGGAVTEVQIPTAGAYPQAITGGPDGNMWFSEGLAGKIGRAAPPCSPGGGSLCLDDQPGDRRWQVTTAYHTAEGGGSAGYGTAVQLSSLGVTQGGLFWFFAANNPEMLVKVVDGCGVNQQFWVFSAAGTNVGFTVTVRDTSTGRAKAYTNPDGRAAPPIQDTSAFACINGDGTSTAPAPPDPDAADLAPQGGALAASPLHAATSSLPSAIASAPGSAIAASPEAAADCTPGAKTLCIDSRFQVTVSYNAGSGNAGKGNAISLQTLGIEQGGLFWFFSGDNPEMLIKVIDGCAVNKRYWIFYAADTNVGFTVTVIDGQTRHQKIYTNPEGTAAPPIQDTAALACP
jgi:streptogramin lyase